MPVRAACVCCVLGALLASPARAGFDAATGKVDDGGAAVLVSFDNLDSLSRLGMQVFQHGELLGDDAIEGALVDDGAIEGEGAIALGGRLSYAMLDAGKLSRLVGRRVELELWQRPQGTRLSGVLYWTSGNVEIQDAITVGTLGLQPTGEVTDDGWERWTTGPFDLGWGGALLPSTIYLYDSQGVGVNYAGLSYDDDVRVLVDGLAVFDLGPAAVPLASCTALDEAEACGPLGLCHYGVCVDAALHEGQAIVDAELRADYLARRSFEVEHVEGGRTPQARTPALVDALDALAADPEASSPARFWPALRAAYAALEDGHASAPMASFPQYMNAGICLHEGEADLLPLVDGAAPIVPLVFHTADNELGAQLLPGDALVEIDGLPTAEWVARSPRLVAHSGDPAAFSVVTAPSVLPAALDSGATVTFARCTNAAGCDDAAVEHITIDLGALVRDDVRSDDMPALLRDYQECDYRFVRPAPSNASTQNTAYPFAGAVDGADGSRVLVINGVPPQYFGAEGQAWFDVVGGALDDRPARLVLDERRGDGGTLDAVDFLVSPLLDDDAVWGVDFLPQLEDEMSIEDRTAFVECVDTSGLGCGNGFRWVIGELGTGAVRGSSSSTKLAILLGSDVSGNDFVTRMLATRAAPTRIFGPAPTWGAFGVVWTMPAHLGEVYAGALQVHDSLFLAGRDDDNLAFATSTGVPPNEVIRQRQSDAIAGRDTTLERARAWLAEP